MFRSLFSIDEPPTLEFGYCFCGGISARFPRGIICGREGAAFIPVGRPSPRPPKALRPVPGGLGSAFGSNGLFIDVVGG